MAEFFGFYLDKITILVLLLNYPLRHLVDDLKVCRKAIPT